ncbi:hypothetical protein L9W73_15230 [Vibrio aestuarianus]|uniref:Uncharacterized protein n=1 Tax=Vibrio aestuarianus TaxID=28171 RepID=A0A9X4FNE9_9VIBR|nr:hypothetical protein [Vibrio aestuarianus]MDE1316464.1 hypothetical protein [Vibrio aestuarianus]MDE1358645.1 hypothetical protein [Vibrio aestuarianus]
MLMALISYGNKGISYMNCSASCFTEILESLEKKVSKSRGKHTSDENMQISLAIMAISLANLKGNLIWGNKINCKAVVELVCREWEEISPNYAHKGYMLSNLNKDISAGLKLLKDKFGVKICM